MRAGLFGDVTVRWKAGDPLGEAPSGVSPGSGEQGAQATWITASKICTDLDLTLDEYSFVMRSAPSVSSCPGSLFMAHGERTKVISLAASAERSELVSYAIHLTGATSHTSFAKLRYITAEQKARFCNLTKSRRKAGVWAPAES